MKTATCHPERKHKARGLCKNCWTNERYQKVRDQIRAHNLKKCFGLSVEDYDRLLASQGGGCALCHTEVNKDGRRLFVDHNHETKKVRGILCNRCNCLIGQLEKTPSKLLEVLIYLSDEGKLPI